MSEVNKINLNDTLFDIEDTVARENITTMQASIANDLDACSLVAEEDKSIAGAYAVKQLNDSLGGVKFITEEGKGITGYTLTGADTVFPFKSGLELPFELLKNQFGILGSITLGTNATNGVVLLGSIPIDFTNISQIETNIHHTNATWYFALTDEKLSSSAEVKSNASFTQATSGNTTKVFDTSDITGEKYLSIYMYTSGTINGYLYNLVVS